MYLFILKSFFSLIILLNQMLEAQIVINEFMASNNNTIADNEGEFDDWLELANNSADTINLFGWYLSDNASNPFKHQLSDSIFILPYSFFLFWADDDEEQGIDHLSFKLGSGGEDIILTNSNEIIVDSTHFGQQEEDNSYGRYPDFIGDWCPMDNPTPGTENSHHDTSQYSLNPFSSHQSGFYEDSIYVLLSSDEEFANIFYTTDGSIPNSNSNLYLEPILLLESTVIRVVSTTEGFMPSSIKTYNYLINTNFQLPVMALTVDPDDFPIGDLEYNLHVTYFNKEGEIGFNTDAGIERHGDLSQQNPYRIEFKSEYGQSHIDYPLFDNRENNRYKRLILRHASNDRFPGNNKAHLRDGIIQTVYSQIHPEGGYSSFKSLHVYINNDYWGIYHLRERQDKHYIEDVFGYEDVDLLERAFGFDSNKNAIEGDWQSYNTLEIYIDSLDMNAEDNLEYLKENIHYEEFVDYWILQVFMGNFDWLANNIKYFRPRSVEGKWRWLLWDTDHGLGTTHYQSGTAWGDVQTDYLSWSTGLEGPRVWSGSNNRFIRAILRSDQGRIDFINRFADLLNTTFKNENLIDVVDSLVNIISPDMSYHADRWNGNLIDWENAVNNVRNYALERPNHVIDHIKNKFNLDSSFSITIEAPYAFTGSVKLNSILIDDFPWTGTYFSETPIEIFMITNQDSQIFYWENMNHTIFIDDLVSDTTFRLIPNVASSNSIVINEFLLNSDTCCVSESGEIAGFIELYNRSDTSVALNGMLLTNSLDNQEYFSFENDSSVISINPGEFALLWNGIDSSLESNNINFELDISGGQIYLLSSQDSSVLDFVLFDYQEPDISFGRLSDGADNWIDLHPTPGHYNVSLSPIIVLSQDSILLSNVSIYDSIKTDVQIFNDGYSELIISNIIIENENIYSDFHLPIVLSNGEFENLSFTIYSTEVGLVNSYITLESNDLSNPNSVINFSANIDYAEHPVIVDTKDVPNDEGYRISLSFLPSKYDLSNSLEMVSEYIVYRFSRGYEDSQWDLVGNLASSGDTIYSLDISTVCNISSDSLCQSLFRVAALLENNDSLVWSDSYDGYSLDNLAPQMPIGISTLEIDNYLTVRWLPNQEQDIRGYILDKSLDSLFETEQTSSFFIIDTFFTDSSYVPYEEVYYRLIASDYSNNESFFSDTVSFFGSLLSTEEHLEIPLEFSLLQNYPNPFNPKTEILYSLPKDIHVRITIHDILGRKIKTLVDDFQLAGYKNIDWNATNQNNQLVSAGFYFYMIEAGSFNKTNKMILLK